MTTSEKTGEQPVVRLSDGHVMPQLGLGVWQAPEAETAQIVRAAIEAGFRSIDTASAYGNERGVGEATEGRDDIFVTTKLWNSNHGYGPALRAFDKSIRKLRRQTLDLYLIHWPRPQPKRSLFHWSSERLDRYVETWKAFIRLQADGRVRSIGVSNFNADHLERLINETGVKPVVNQVELHPRFQQKALRAVHQRLGIATESWSPLGQGAILAEPTIVDIARKHNKTPGQVVIRWHLDSGLIVIPKTVRPERQRENLGALEFKLDAEDMALIDALDTPDGRIGPDPMTASF